jgi:hypothetical protein
MLGKRGVTFTVQRGADWVSFRLTEKMFEIFTRKVRSFKERFFLVRPKSVAALDNLLEVAKDGIQKRRPFFHLCWSQDHFAYEPRDFGRSIANLTDEEKNLRQQLWAFYQSLSRRVKTDKRGNPVMSADGTPTIEPRQQQRLALLLSRQLIPPRSWLRRRCPWRKL